VLLYRQRVPGANAVPVSVAKRIISSTVPAREPLIPAPR
jgi:hypothetical protein